MVLFGHMEQLPEPSQLPLWPQVSESVWEQSPPGSVPAATAEQAPAPLQAWQLGHSFPGSSPLGCGEQVPSLPETLQAWQVPVQVLLQQKPSTQSPLAHSMAPLQASPLAFLSTQAEPLQ